MRRREYESRPVVQKIAHTLRQRVIHGQYAAGSFLPSERALASELKVSRMSVSRALEQLAREGILEQLLGTGTRVLPDAAKRLPPGAVAVLHAVFATLTKSEPALILQGIVDALAVESFNYEIVPLAPEDYAGPLAKAVRAEQILQLPNRYGGLIFIEGFAQDCTLELQRRGVPLVVANLENNMDVSATWVDHKRIASTAMEMLAAMGHRRIGLVTTVPSRAFYEKTIRGYRESLVRLGLPQDERLIGLCPTSGPLEAYLAAQSLLKLDARPTAIVCGRDVHAEGVCRAASEAGLTVGRDLSVVGFDNISWLQDAPSLTTFEEPCYELGAVAARMLVERMRTAVCKVEKREISAPLILRRSVGPPAQMEPVCGDVSLKLVAGEPS